VSPTPSYHPAPEPARSNMFTALISGALIALIVANVYLFVQIDKVRTEMAQNNEKLATQISNLTDTSKVSSASQIRHIETLKQELEAAKQAAQSQARSLSSQAKAEAQAHADQLARQIQAEEAKEHQQVTSELSEVKTAASTANTKIADVATDVGGVKTNLSQTQADLQKTIADLKSARGDLGVQSGLIATNANELAALKRLGERNYTEFKLGKTKERQRVGDITLLLKKTDPKKNKYTVEVMADDKLTVKQDKNVNEPVQFYTSKARLPYELVVNQVQKDQIVGYLATPKDTGR
jgi:DNA repair exonuclease SbcCD ATPase subunit